MSDSMGMGANDGTLSRRTVLKGMGAAGVAAAGGSAATGSAAGGSLGDDCLVDWPPELGTRIDVAGNQPDESGTVPHSGDLVVFVPGWLNEDVIDAIDINGSHLANALDEALRDEGYTGKTVVAMWDSMTLWSLAKSRADDAGKTLATWLDWNAMDYDSVTLVAHSLGARVTLKALNELQWESVDSVALLGGAVDPDAVCEDYEAGIEDFVDHEVYNYHSEDDGTVCNLYAIRELESAIGCSGSECDGSGWQWWRDESEPPANFENVDVTGRVEGHCGYLKPAAMDNQGENCIDDVVDNQLSEYADVDDTSGASGGGSDEGGSDGGSSGDGGSDDGGSGNGGSGDSGSGDGGNGDGGSDDGGSSDDSDDCWLFCW